MPIIIVKLLVLCSNLLPKSALEILAPPLLRCPKPRPTSVATMSRRTRPRKSWWRTPRTTRPCRNPSQNSFCQAEAASMILLYTARSKVDTAGDYALYETARHPQPYHVWPLSLLPCWTVYKRWKNDVGNPPTASGLSLLALVLNHLVRNSLNNITKLLACARALQLDWADTAIKAGAAAVTVEATSSTTMTYSVVNPPWRLGPAAVTLPTPSTKSHIPC